MKKYICIALFALALVALVGTVGALENDTISTAQALAQSLLFIALEYIALRLYK